MGTHEVSHDDWAGCQKLAAAVLEDVINDLEYEGKNPIKLALKEKARTWIFSDWWAEHLEFWCGVNLENPDGFKKKAAEILGIEKKKKVVIRKKYRIRVIKPGGKKGKWRY